MYDLVTTTRGGKNRNKSRVSGQWYEGMRDDGNQRKKKPLVAKVANSLYFHWLHSFTGLKINQNNDVCGGMHNEQIINLKIFE